jgi:hypothetical protein
MHCTHIYHNYLLITDRIVKIYVEKMEKQIIYNSVGAIKHDSRHRLRFSMLVEIDT